MTGKPHLAYIFERFPTFTQTFCVREILELERIGVKPVIFSIHDTRDEAVGHYPPDLAEAVESPRRLSENVEIAHRVLELVSEVPTPVWGRDELRAGEMWNSNSVISWLIKRSGLDVEAVHPPRGGRAPGWLAGITVASRCPFEENPAAAEAELDPRERGGQRDGADDRSERR